MSPEMTLPDEVERRRIVQELDTTFLVEAGAGSGKTQAMVDRMIALVETGRAAVDQLAAITFTKKAAAELRERFQVRMELRLREAPTCDAAQRLETALLEIDRAYIGTIHSFCGRLLRERPLEAGVDPAFKEVSGAAARILVRESWQELMGFVGSEAPALADRLRAGGLRPAQLYTLYQSMVELPDVELPAAASERPNPDLARQKLEALLKRAGELLPRQEPDSGWDPLQSKVRRLQFYRRFHSWDSDVAFFEALEIAVTASNKLTQKRWNPGQTGRNLEAKELGAAFDEFAAGVGGRTLHQWWAHRYAAAVDFARAAADYHEARRMRLGRLSFQDLLMGAARLLRESPAARRALARRYRFVLVDEFQDTDPVQAEVMFLLTATDEDVSTWTEAKPRPGALFVVGDPKQSIYRFRRADIAVYNLVKRLLEQADGAEVLELVTNFRSTEPFKPFVETAFRDGQTGFPSEAATEFQAKFAPLETRKPAAHPGGIYAYEVEGSNQGSVTENDASGIAALIASRLDDSTSGRSPGDFLVLTWRRFPLNEIARALESWNVPVQVSGGGVTVDAELSELIVLLRALGDPDDSVRTLAALVGLFFGVDYDELYRYRSAGHRLSFLTAPVSPGPVGDALRRLHRWYRRSLEVPGDILVGEIVDETGVLAYAAAGELGGTRAGSLIHAVEVIREGMASGATSLEGLADFLVDALEDSDVEAPLEPGRKDVVRVMNIHKAKGLQAPVVVLACPCGLLDLPPTVHVERGPDGRGKAYFSVCEKDGRSTRVLAQPADWDRHASAEGRFRAAEDDRLRYVAVTRAREELLVSRSEKMESKGTAPWAPLINALDEHANHIELPSDRPPPRGLLNRPADQIMSEAVEIAQKRTDLLKPSYAVTSVTRLAKGDQSRPLRNATASGILGEEPSGTPWGTAVHRALEAAASGISGQPLGHFLERVLREEGLVDDSGGTLYEAELAEVVTRVGRSEIWRRMRAADELLLEMPVSVRRVSADVSGRMGGEGAPPQLVDGVIDAAFRTGDVWTIIDWKTDRMASEETVNSYEEQLRLYSDAWSQLTGNTVEACILYFIRTDEAHQVAFHSSATANG